MRTVYRGEDLHQIASGQSLCEFLEQLHCQYESQGRVICQVSMNGHVLSEADEVRLGRVPVNQLNELVILTETSGSLPKKVIHQWILELPRVIANTDQLAQEVRFQGFEGRLKNLVELIDTCQLLVESLLQLEDLLVSDDKARLRWIQLQDQLAGSIGETLVAFEAKDLIHFSEVLEYDLADALQRWYEFFCEFVDRSEGSKGPEPVVEGI